MTNGRSWDDFNYRYYNVSAQTRAQAGAQFFDAFTVAGANLPEVTMMRLNFQVDGRLGFLGGFVGTPPTNYGSIGDPQGDAHIEVDYGSTPQLALGVTYNKGTIGVGRSDGAFDSVESRLGGITARFHMDVAVRPTLLAGEVVALSDSYTVAISAFSNVFMVNQYGSYARAYSDFYNTVSLDSITLLDGSTPESHGYSLSFASGLASPNITAVPEPSSLALCGVAGLAGVGYGWRRRRAD